MFVFKQKAAYDIFSLGVILYELITGEKPFFGQNITTVIYKIVNENPISPRELDSTIHPGLSYVISKALAKSPDERYQTCRELAEDLKNYRNLGEAQAPSATVILKAPPAISLETPSRPEVKEKEIQPPVQQQAAPPPVREVSLPPPVKEPEVPPARPPVPPRVERRAQSVPPRVIPPPPARRATSPALWIVLGLIILGGLGAGGYFLFLRPPQPSQVSQPSAATEAAKPPAVTAPATTATPSGGGLSEGAQSAQPTPPPTQAEASAKGKEMQPKPKPPKKEVASVPAEKPPVSAPPPTPAPATEFGQLAVSSNIPGAKIMIDGSSEPGWIVGQPCRLHVGVELARAGECQLQ